MISLAEFGWFPRQLPSEVAAGIAPPFSSDEDDDDEE